MKTTVDIADALLREARKLAAREGVTLRTLIEHALYRVIAETRERGPFKLRDASFEGEGLQKDHDASWNTLRDMIYEGHGG